jgi:hypothetical protein
VFMFITLICIYYTDKVKDAMWRVLMAMVLKVLVSKNVILCLSGQKVLNHER